MNTDPLTEGARRTHGRFKNASSLRRLRATHREACLRYPDGLAGEDISLPVNLKDLDRLLLLAESLESMRLIDNVQEPALEAFFGYRWPSVKLALRRLTEAPLPTDI